MAEQLSWYQRVGLRKPEPRPATGLMQIIDPKFNAYRAVPYDQGGWIPGPADPIPTDAQWASRAWAAMRWRGAK